MYGYVIFKQNLDPGKSSRSMRIRNTVRISVADPERFDADLDPDPTFQADADPDPKLF